MKPTTVLFSIVVTGALVTALLCIFSRGDLPPTETFVAPSDFQRKVG